MSASASRPAARLPRRASTFRPRSAGLRRIACFLTLLMIWQMVLSSPAGVIAQELAKHTPPAPKVHDDPAWHTIDYRLSGQSPLPQRSHVAPLPSLTLLDGVGQLNRLVPDSEPSGWKAELHQDTASKARIARLHLWLGEYVLAHDQQPEQALWHFHRAQKLASSKDSVLGVAAQDKAIAQFYEGAYQQSKTRFYHLLTARPTLPGLDKRHLALWYGHAKACAGYHAERAELGIPEPPQLDPLCGAAALAKCLQAQGQPFDKARVLSAIHITGRGSSLQDVLDAARKLGMKAKAVGADEQALMALPKPMIAFVEKDHFVCLIHADKQGISYLCSDCGPWPGGRVHLSWKQWRKMDASAYALVYKAGSELDTVLSQLMAAKSAPKSGASVAHSSASSGLHTVGLGQGSVGRQSALFSLLKAHLLLELQEHYACGYTPSSARCPNFWCCPYDYCIPCNHGASAGDPVNCSTGEEEYTPEPDLSVYNPIGPSVALARRYDSLRGNDTYESDDFGMGWSHNYNVGVLDTNTLQNWIVPQGGSGSLPATTPALINPTGYPNFPQSGILWNICNNSHTSIASASSPAGWSVAYDSARKHLLVNAPSNATVAENYMVTFAQQTGPNPCSAFFDIIASSSVAQSTDLPININANTYVTVAINGSDSPATGLTWDILYNGATIATSASGASGGWVVYYTLPSPTDYGWPVGKGRLQVGATPFATLGSGYEVRYHTGSSSYSGTFSIVSPTLQPTTQAKSVYFDNGAKISFTPSAVPTAAQPRASCTVAAGSPFLVEWDYSSANALGYYRITFSDRSVWVTTPYYNLPLSQAVAYPLSQIVDRNGNYINFVYGGYGPSGFPLLSTINNSNGIPLLTFNRANNGTGNLTSVADNTGRMIFYNVGTYACQNVPAQFPQSHQELDHVSQYGSSTNNNPPNRYVYGYTDILNSDPNNEAVPFLTSITVPSPTGSGTATATINYAANTCFVANLVDANGNMRAYYTVDASHTQVQIYNPQNQLVYAYTFGFNSDMSTGTVTDGVMNNSGANTEIIYSATYGDPNDPYRPSEVEDGNGYAVGGANNKGVWKYTWDQFGHCTSMTSPYGTETTLTWNYANFALGELTKAQQGSKSPVSFTYYEPSGLLDTVIGPPPGTTGSQQTVTYTLTWDSLGNLLTATSPGNNAAASVTTTYNYTTDGSYNQAEALGQPIAITDPLGHVSHLRYDSQGSVTSAWDALGNTYNTSYNVAEQPLQTLLPATGQSGTGNSSLLNTYLYPGGPITQIALYDESGNLFRQVSPVFGKEGEPLSVTGNTDPFTNTFDADYRVVKYTDGNNNATAYTFNQQGFVSQIQYANGDTVQFTSFDADGNLLSMLNGRGQTVNYLYNDPASQRTDIQYPGSPALNEHFSYDEYGRPTGLSDGSGTKSYAWDDASNPTSVITTYTNLPAQTIGYAYYPDASRQSMSTPGGSFNYTYDAARRWTGLTNPSGQSFGWSYLNNNWLATQTNGVATTSTYNYNALGELTSESTNQQGTQTLLSSYTGLLYDAAGNLLQMTSSLQNQPTYSGTTTWQYNIKDQMTQESSTRLGGYTYSYGYDSAGNATTFRGAARTFNSVNELSTNVYDHDGNATTFGEVNLSFDAESRLTGAGARTFGYSGSQRAWTNNGSTPTYYLYDDDTPVCELDGNGNVQQTNTFGVTGLLSRMAPMTGVALIPDLFGNGGQVASTNGTVSISDIYDLLGWRNDTGNYGSDLIINVAGARGGVQGDPNTGHLYPPTGGGLYDPGQGLGGSRYPSGAGGGNGYSGGGYGSGDTDPGDEWMFDPNVRMGSGLKHFSDLGAARQMERDAGNYALGMIPGYDLIPALTGRDAFGCDLTAAERWMKGINGGVGLFSAAHGLSELGGPATDVLAGGEAGGLCRGGCFLAGTSVWMAENVQGKERLRAKPIEQVQPGERVISRDEHTCKTEAKMVQHTTVRQIDRVLILTLADARTGQTVETITTTKEHPFYVQGKGFTPAGRLALGNAIITRAGPLLIVKGFHWNTRPQGYTVYNLVVADAHTYFVGEHYGGIWVHNIDCEPLSTDAKNMARAEARDLWQEVTGRRAIWDDMDVHHNCPLEYAHLFADHPNDLSNLIGVSKDVHQQINNIWTQFRTRLGGTPPTPQQVQSIIDQIEQQLGGSFRRLQ